MTPPAHRSKVPPKQGFKLDVPHSETCWLKDSPRAFVLYDGHDSRDTIGRRGGSQPWERFRCNNPDCPAVALVRWDVLGRTIHDGLNQ